MHNQGEVVASSVLDRFERFTNVDDHYVALMGWPRAALIGRSMLDLTHPDDRTGNRTLLDRLYDRNEAFRITKRYRRPDNSYVRVQVHVAMAPDGLGGRQLIGTAHRVAPSPPVFGDSRAIAGRAIGMLLAGRMALGAPYFSGAPAEILLLLFHQGHRPLTLARIADRLDYTPAVTLRWLRALADAGLVHPPAGNDDPVRLTLWAEATLTTILAAPTEPLTPA